MADTINDLIQGNSRLGDRLEQMDNEINGFAKMVATKLKQRIITMNIGQRVRAISKEDPKLIKHIRGKAGKKNGEIERVAWRVTRPGIFTERGVGKGRPVGSSAARKAAKPWLSSVLDEETQNLLNLLEEEYGDIVAAELAINIPGVFQTRISK